MAPASTTASDRGLLAINHEATTDETRSSFFLHADGGIVGLQGLDMLFTRLMDDLWQFVFRQLGHALRNDLVERLRPQAAADDQHMQRAAALGKTLGRRGDAGDFRTHRVTHPFALVQHLREAGHDAVGDAGQHLEFALAELPQA